MNYCEALGRKVDLDKQRLARHHEVQALGNQIARFGAEFHYGPAAGRAPLAQRVAAVQSLLERVAVLAREMDEIDAQARALPLKPDGA